jgi:hypothetical protein
MDRVSAVEFYSLFIPAVVLVLVTATAVLEHTPLGNIVDRLGARIFGPRDV